MDTNLNNTNAATLNGEDTKPSVVKNEEIVDSNEDDDDSDDHGGNETNDPDNPNGQHHPIAEFLYQLTKMLTDDNNEIIEWADGRIKVHYPERLEGEVLHKYFRHSKFASFQRQLNYFGFRKIAGKGKMSPCSYINEEATSDIRSLLLIKRKTNGSAARKAALQQRVAAMSNSAAATAATSMMNYPFALPTGGLNFPGLPLNPNHLLGSGVTADQQRALANAMALLAQSGLTTMPNFATNSMLLSQAQAPPQPARNSVNLQQILSLQNQSQLLQQHLLNQQQQQQKQQQQAQQNQAALNLLQSHSNIQPPSQVASVLADVNPGANSQYNSNSKGNNSNHHNGGSVVNSTTLEQLQAQLKALSQQHQQLQQQHHQQQQQQASSANGTGNAFTALLNQVAANQVASSSSSSNNHHASMSLATAALNAQQGTSSAAAMGSASLPQQPATAAMNAQSSSNTNSNALFDSAINLKSLLDEHKAQTEQQQQQQLQQNATAQAIWNRLPSQSGLFHGNDSGVNNNMSTISLGNLLGSSNRLSSLLSLNSFLGSREASLADFGSSLNFRDHNHQFGNSNSNSFTAQLSAAAAVAAASAQSQQQQQQNDASKYRSNN